MLRNLSAAITIMLLSSFAWGSCTGSSPSWTSTIDATSVQSCINNASNGDVITIASGSTSTWSSVSISGKYLQLICSPGPCTIDGTLPLLVVTPSSSGQTRISGFTTNNDPGSDSAPTIDWNGSFGAQIGRIDHWTFGTSSITTPGTWIVIGGTYPVPVLVDHNTFNAYGAADQIHLDGYGASSNAGWFDDITPGSPNMTYIEANSFDNWNDTYLCSAEEAYFGSWFVVRYNNLNFCQLGIAGTSGQIWNRWFEAYDNTFNANGNNQSDWMQIRGGSGVVFDNSGSNWESGDPTPTIGMDVESSVCTGSYPASGYPVEYQVGQGIITGSTTQDTSPIYFWNNGTNMPVQVYNGSVGNSDSCLAQNTDYFISTSQPATISRCESSVDVTAGCPASASYTPFTYPYPLTANGLPNPSGCGG